jgi:hypothetical protein
MIEDRTAMFVRDNLPKRRSLARLKKRSSESFPSRKKLSAEPKEKRRRSLLE